MRTTSVLTFIAALSLLIGCSQNHGRPVDLPRLYPVNITITADGAPLEGAGVTLQAKTSATYGTASAETNAAGIATIRTYGFPGAPLGEYTVTVEKRIIEGVREVIDSEGVVNEVGGRVYQLVNDRYVNRESTPFSITVTERGARETFEVGAPVRVFLFNQ
jgi:hypothetical protein